MVDSKTSKNLLWVIIFVFAATLLTTPILSTIFAPKAHAAYQGHRLIDNPVFLDSKAMSKNQIQNFLVARNSGLKDMTFQLQCYGAGSKEREWYTAAGAQCDTQIPASHIIYYGAQIYGVNPRVILATMQKEQSLITAPNPTNWQLSQAMGYGCPTSGSCSDSSNFSYQVDSGTWVLRFHYERARGNMTWWRTDTNWTCGTEKNFYKPSLYPKSKTRFYDGNGVHYRTYDLANAATSSFYCYTPHAYNNPSGLFGHPKYGTKGQYYSGSYNFVLFFELWFGSTLSGPLKFSAIDTPRWMQIKNDTYKKWVRTGADTGSLIPAGTPVFFTSKIHMGGEWYLRTKLDTEKNRETAIPYEDIEEITIEFTTMNTPRWMETATETYNRNLRTDKKGKTYHKGSHIFFQDIVEIGGVQYLRNRYESARDRDYVIPLDDVKNLEPNFTVLDNPRTMKAAVDTRKKNPITGVSVGDLITTSTSLSFYHKVRIGGEWYLRTAEDTDSNLGIGIPYTDVDELLNYESLDTPRKMRITTDTYKKDLVTGENVGIPLEEGLIAFFSSKVQIDGEWYIRTRVDTERGYDRAILLSELGEIN